MSVFVALQLLSTPVGKDRNIVLSVDWRWRELDTIQLMIISGKGSINRVANIALNSQSNAKLSHTPFSRCCFIDKSIPGILQFNRPANRIITDYHVQVIKDVLPLRATEASPDRRL